jgi:hypothetical protein
LRYFLIGNPSVFYVFDMDKKQIVQEYIDNKHLQSNGSCGIIIPNLSSDLGIDHKELIPILLELYQEKAIIIRPGINGKMIFKNEKNLFRPRNKCIE